MAFVFEDRQGERHHFEGDFLDRLGALGDGWQDPVAIMEGSGLTLVATDDAGVEWLRASGYAVATAHDDDGAARSPKTAPASPYLNAVEAAAYVRKPTLKAFYSWAERHGLKGRKGSRRLLFTRAELDAALNGETHTTRRRRPRR